MKRYWLFLYNTYYPSGGMQDFWKDFDSVDECIAEHETQDDIDYEIFDSKQMVVVSCDALLDVWDVHGHEDDADYKPDHKHLNKLYPIELWNG